MVLSTEARVYCAMWSIPKPAGEGLTNTQIKNRLISNENMFNKSVFPQTCLSDEFEIEVGPRLLEFLSISGPFFQKNITRRLLGVR